MVRFFEGRDASEESVSRLTGILAASLPAAQFLTSFFWGRFSDRVGRKPVMLVGNVSGAVSMLALGWSPVYTAALLCRFIGGLFNGTSVCVPNSRSHSISDVPVSLRHDVMRAATESACSAQCHQDNDRRELRRHGSGARNGYSRPRMGDGHCRRCVAVHVSCKQSDIIRRTLTWPFNPMQGHSSAVCFHTHAGIHPTSLAAQRGSPSFAEGEAEHVGYRLCVDCCDGVLRF